MKGGNWNAPRLTKVTGQFFDYVLHRHDRHEITVIYDSDRRQWWSVLRIFEDPDDWYGRDRYLPDAMTAKFRNYILENLR